MTFATIIRRDATGSGWEMVRGSRKHRNPIRVEAEARLWMTERGRMILDFADCEGGSEAARELAEAYGLEVDCDTVDLGMADDGGVPEEYAPFIADAWKELAGW